MNRPRGNGIAVALWFGAAIVYWAMLAVWLVGRVASDRWRWSQFLAWIPEEAFVILCALPALGALVVAFRRRAHRRRTALAGVGAFALLLAHLLLIHWRLPNLLSRPAPGATPGALRILCWNATFIEHGEHISGTIGPQNADLAVIANPNSHVAWNEVIEGFGQPTALIWQDGFLVLSHVRILRHGVLWLGLDGSRPGLGPPRRGARSDPGRALFFEIDTVERLGRPTVVWVIDMPSDWREPRWTAAANAAGAIAAWQGPEFLHDEAGGVITRAAQERGFPKPDLVMGDFNAPRGSASLSELARGMENAFDQGGAGFAASWPTEHLLQFPHRVFHLDQMFVAPGLRAVRYDLFRPVFGFHWPQIAEVVAR